MFTIKKINAKESKKTSFQNLTNEVGILKILKDPHIIQCHKMLTTSNNYYLVYDYCEGSTLEDILKKSVIYPELSKKQPYFRNKNSQAISFCLPYYEK